MHQTIFKASNFLFAGKIWLSNKDTIGKAYLALHLLMFGQLLLAILGIHQGHHGIQDITICNIVIDKEGLRYRAWICDSGGFNHNPIEVNLFALTLFPQLIKCLYQIPTNRTTYTTIAHLHNLFLRTLNQDVVIDVLFAKLIFDNSNLFAVLLGQDMLK